MLSWNKLWSKGLVGGPSCNVVTVYNHDKSLLASGRTTYNFGIMFDMFYSIR